VVRRSQQPDEFLPVARRHVVNGLSLVEDLVYVGLGVLLAAGALALLISAFRSSVVAIFSHSFASQVVGLLDQILLVLLIIELLYTVQVSFREHGLLAEPFLVVALIAVIRRVLVLTAEVPKLPQAGEEVFRHALLEMALLTVMIAVLVGSLVVMQWQARRHGQDPAIERREAA
jgi:uncharacterized membrane protein (DUF373 family)